MHTHTTNDFAGGPAETGFKNSQIKHQRVEKGFVQLPNKAGLLALHLQGFLRLLMERAWKFRLKYTIDTSDELAEMLGKLAGKPPEKCPSRSTVERYLADLKAAHFIATAVVNGRRRIYPVDSDGNPTRPPELAAARPKKRARAPRKSGAQPVAPTMEDPARVVVVEREINQNECEKIPERQRQQAITEASQKPPEVPQAVETPAAPASQGTEEEQLLAELGPEDRKTLDGLTPARRAKLIRESLRPRSVTYLKKQLAVIRAEDPPVATATMSTADTIRLIPTRKDPDFAKDAAQRLANELKDQKYYIGFEMLMMAIWRGAVDAGAVAASLEYTMSNPVRNRGKYFWRTAQDRGRFKARDLKRLTAGG